MSVTDWRHWPYPFPLDDHGALFWEVLDRVSIKYRADLDWTLAEKFLVVLADVKAAIYLRLAFDNGRLMSVDGSPILEEHEVLIADHEREACEALLRDNCPSEAEWFALVVLHARTDAARQAFNDAYRAVIAEVGWPRSSPTV